MWEKLRVIFAIPELCQKILLTLALLAVYRIGYQIPLPMIDQVKLAQQRSDKDSFAGLLQQVSVISAADMGAITIFGLGIMPYISASIILQLLSSVWPPLEELRKEGESGRKKINEYTRYLTVLLCVFQSAMYLQWMISGSGNADGTILNPDFANNGVLTLGWYFVAIVTMTCGTVFVMWLGEQIDEFGIGNGISLLIMAGILCQMPKALMELSKNAKFELTSVGNKTVGIETLILLAVLFVVVVFAVVFITLGRRNITTQSAKHVRGRKVFGGTKQHLPLRLNQSGVMPIIFASSLLMIPSMLFRFLADSAARSDLSTASQIFGSLATTFGSGTSFGYNLLYIILIYFFCYFWTAISFNPKEMADNLKDFGSFIPGYRPGKRTEEHLEKVMVRITYVGAAFLSLVAIVPTIITSWLGISPNIASFYGGTGLLIAVSVTFDLIQKIDSHLVMRDYRGLLES